MNYLSEILLHVPVLKLEFFSLINNIHWKILLVLHSLMTEFGRNHCLITPWLTFFHLNSKNHLVAFKFKWFGDSFYRKFLFRRHCTPAMPVRATSLSGYFVCVCEFPGDRQWMYRHTSFHCASLYCDLQILCFLQMEGLWHSCVKQVHWCHFSDICSLHISVSHFC